MVRADPFLYFEFLFELLSCCVFGDPFSGHFSFYSHSPETLRRVSEGLPLLAILFPPSAFEDFSHEGV